MKDKIMLLVLTLCLLCTFVTAGAAAQAEDATALLRSAKTVDGWTGNEWVMLTCPGPEGGWGISYLLNMETNEKREIDWSYYCGLFAVNGIDYFFEDRTLTRLSDGASLSMTVSPDSGPSFFFPEPDKMMCRDGSVIDLTNMEYTTRCELFPDGKGLLQMWDHNTATCYGHAFIDRTFCPMGYYDWTRGRMVHEDVWILSAVPLGPVMDGCAFGNREYADGRKEALVICLDTDEVVRSFEGEWLLCDANGNVAKIYGDGTAAVYNGAKELFQIVDWRTGEVLLEMATENRELCDKKTGFVICCDAEQNGIVPGEVTGCVWTLGDICVNEEEDEWREVYFDLATREITLEYPLTEVQRRLAAEGVKTIRTADGYYVEPFPNETDDEWWWGVPLDGYRAYDGTGALMLEYWFSPRDEDCDGGLFGYIWGPSRLLNEDGWIVIQVPKEGTGKTEFLYGLYTLEDGLLLPPVYDEVWENSNGEGFRVMLNGEWYLYDKHGKQVY